MLVIRTEQLDLLAKASREEFIEQMCRHLRSHFPPQLRGCGDDVLKSHINDALRRSAGYGLTSRQDCCRFLNLAVLYGWQFDQSAAQQWMRDYLIDETVSSPSERLRLLVDQCVHRREIAAHNRQLQDGFGLLQETGP